MTESKASPLPPPPPKVTVLYGPYGDGYAWKITGIPGFDHFGWKRAANEEEARERSRDDARRWTRADAEVIYDKVDVPLQAPKCGGNNDDGQGFTTDGAADIEGVELSFHGACPVQGEGVVDGYEAYYRARGEGWSLTVTLSEQEVWVFGEQPYAFPDGGWLHRDESIANISRAVAAFRARKFGTKDPTP